MFGELANLGITETCNDVALIRRNQTTLPTLVWLLTHHFHFAPPLGADATEIGHLMARQEHVNHDDVSWAVVLLELRGHSVAWFGPYGSKDLRLAARETLEPNCNLCQADGSEVPGRSCYARLKLIEVAVRSCYARLKIAHGPKPTK